MLFGGLGGIARSVIEKHLRDSASKKLDLVGPAFIGAIAGLVVPLFLNASSSSLVQNILENGSHAHRDWFFLIGYSVLAGFVGNLFLTSMAGRSLKLSQEANEISHAAKQVAEGAQKQSNDLTLRITQVVNEQIPLATSRTRDLIRPIALIDSEKYDEAIVELEKVLQADPKNAEAYAWLAYCFKHCKSPDLEAAIGSISAALDIEEPKPCSWLYNLACYKAVGNHPEAEVVTVLQNAFAVANMQQRKVLVADLTDDQDFAILRSRNHGSAFWNFLRDVKRSI